MSRSFKKNPFIHYSTTDTKTWKKISARAFRRREHIWVKINPDKLPFNYRFFKKWWDIENRSYYKSPKSYWRQSNDFQDWLSWRRSISK